MRKTFKLKLCLVRKTKLKMVLTKQSAKKAEKENTEASVKQGSNPTAHIVQSETERTTAPAPEFKAVSDTVYVKTNGGSVRVRSSCDTSTSDNVVANVGNATELTRTGTSEKMGQSGI